MQVVSVKSEGVVKDESALHHLLQISQLGDGKALLQEPLRKSRLSAKIHAH